MSSLWRLPLGLALTLVVACPKPASDDGDGPTKIPKDRTTRVVKEVPRPQAAFQFDDAPDDSEPTKTDTPLSLTASDGTGLRLVSLEVRGVVEEPLGFTQLKLVFENPEPRTIEGRFKITLPPKATISRFAMRIGERWQEGEVVERQAARRAYEDFLHRRQDPALLEQQGGNEFSARVFPIPARGNKELIVSFSQPLPRSDTPYRVHLKGLPKLDRLDARVVVSKKAAGPAATSLGGQTETREVVAVKKTNWVPDRDLTVPARNVEGRLGLRHKNLVVARVSPVGSKKPEPIESAVILVDSSASRALGWSKQVQLVRRLVEGLGRSKSVPVRVVAFDQSVKTIFEGNASEFGSDHVRELMKRRALGASDIAGALRWLDSELASAKQKYERVIVLTDGVATAGDVEGDALRKHVSALSSRGVQRLDTLVVGGIRDEGLLSGLVAGGLPSNGMVINADAGASEIATRLTQATLTGVMVSVPGAKWVWPTTLDSVQAGDEVLIYADLPEGKAFSVKLTGADVVAQGDRLDVTERPLLHRAWVKARIDRLSHQRDTIAAQDSDLRGALKKQIIELSTKNRVLSPFTALLVLETEADYRRFNIDRRALSDILVANDSGLELMLEEPGERAEPGRQSGQAESSGACEESEEKGASGSERPTV